MTTAHHLHGRWKSPSGSRLAVLGKGERERMRRIKKFEPNATSVWVSDKLLLVETEYSQHVCWSRSPLHKLIVLMTNSAA